MKLTKKRKETLKKLGSEILDCELNENVAMLNGDVDLAFIYRQKKRSLKKEFYKKSKQGSFNRNLEKEIIKKFGKGKNETN